jgi:hypothetical protein
MSKDYSEIVTFKCSETFHPEGKGSIALVYLDDKLQEHIAISTIEARTGNPVHLHFDTRSELVAFSNVISQVIDKYVPKVKKSNL